MSQFFSSRYRYLTPYTPGEQPQERRYIKLNTNESPFPPSPGVLKAVYEEAQRLQLYSDPESRKLRKALAEYFGMKPEQFLAGNGSDELLNFAFMAFCDEEHPAFFPDITNGFYPVYAQLNHIPYREIPLREDLTFCLDDVQEKGMIVLANPNAPTGLAKSLDEIEALLQKRPDDLLVDLFRMIQAECLYLDQDPARSRSRNRTFGQDDIFALRDFIQQYGSHRFHFSAPPFRGSAVRFPHSPSTAGHPHKSLHLFRGLPQGIPGTRPAACSANIC